MIIDVLMNQYNNDTVDNMYDMYTYYKPQDITNWYEQNIIDDINNWYQ